MLKDKDDFLFRYRLTQLISNHLIYSAGKSHMSGHRGRMLVVSSEECYLYIYSMKGATQASFIQPPAFRRNSEAQGTPSCCRKRRSGQGGSFSCHCLSHHSALYSPMSLPLLKSSCLFICLHLSFFATVSPRMKTP